MASSVALAVAAMATPLLAGAACADTPIYLSADGRASINPDFADSPPVASDPDYGKVLVTPDDAEFNLSYAQRRAAAGDLIGAAATLERVLLNRPNWHAARLFYAATLYRLDDLQAARRELALLKTVPLTPPQKAEVDKFDRLTQRRDAKTRFAGQVSIGFAYDSNAVGALANAVNLGAGFPIDDDGLSVVAAASLDGATKLGDSSEVYASISGLSKSDLSGPEQRYVRADAGLGIGFAAAGFGVRAGGLVRDVSIFGDHYEFDYGGRVEVTRRISPRLAFNANLEIDRQSFDEPAAAVAAANGEDHDGTRIDGAAGLSLRLTARQTLAFELGYEDKDADYGPYAYHGPHFYGAYSALLGRGSYFSVAGTVRRYEYREPDLLFTTVRRKDTRSFVRMALGAPISAFSASGSTADYRERLRLEGALSYTRRDSRPPYLDFDSVGAETRLIYRFGG